MNSRLQTSIREMLSGHYSMPCSLAGWQFLSLIDCEYLDGSLEKIKNSPKRNAGIPKHSGDAVALNEPQEFIERIKNCPDIQQKLSLLEELNDLNAPLLTVDSFPGLEGNALNSALSAQFDAQRLNVVIVGAGPIGLSLASSLKRALKDRINILVIENRVSRQHHKRPYTRNWITHLLIEGLQDMIAEDVLQIFSQLSGGRHVGVNLNLLEALIQLSCRILGIKFLFNDSGDLSFLDNSEVALIFDASGNGLNPIHMPAKLSDIQLIRQVPTNSPNMNINIAPYGVKLLRKPDNQQISIGSSGNIFMPFYRNSRMKVAQIKVVNMPIQLYGALLSYIIAHNVDNKFYIWHGDLLPAINQAILVINLSKSEYHSVAMILTESAKIEKVVSNGLLMESLDSRVVQVLKIIAGNPEAVRMARVEPPFLLEPFLYDVLKYPETLYGKPVIRVGDSIYNGNVKFGNGLGAHLAYARHIKSILARNFGT
jgi:hypothetical protein